MTIIKSPHIAREHASTKLQPVLPARDNADTPRTRRIGDRSHAWLHHQRA